MYSSDTVYSTTTFRPVSPSPITPPPDTPSPQRTRKLETPLHFDGGLFSDIRSQDGKLLSKVTVDRVQRSTRHDITDSPPVKLNIDTREKSYVDDIVKTETITNENVITVKFTPVPPELDSPRLLTPSQMYQMQQKSPTAVEYIKDNFEDLQSYKIVNSVCKEKLFELDNHIGEINNKGTLMDSLDVEPVKRACSPLANLLISEQLTKIDSYLQESLEVCSGVKDRFTPSPIRMGDVLQDHMLSYNDKPEEHVTHIITELHNEKSEEIRRSHERFIEDTSRGQEKLAEEKPHVNETVVPPSSFETSVNKSTPKLNSVSDKRPGVLSAICNMPIHYHAAILCFLLIIYNLIYQYIKQTAIVIK